MNFAVYRKTITALVTSAIGWATLVVTSDSAGVTDLEWIAGATALAIALGVYAVPNSPDERGHYEIGSVLVMCAIALVVAILVNEWLYDLNL